MTSVSSRRGHLLAALAALQWSTIGVLGKSLMAHGLSPLTVVTLRATLAFLTLLAWMACAGGRPAAIDRADRLFFAAFGLFGMAAPCFLFFAAVERIGVAVATVILYSYPVLVTFVAAIVFGERITAPKVGALVLVSIGVGLLSGCFHSSVLIDARGVGLALLSSACAAAFSIFSKRAVQRYSSATVLVYSLGSGALFLLAAHVLSQGWPPLPRSADLWLLLVTLAWIPTLGANFAYVSALRHLEASQASITASLEPLVAAALACVVLGEILSPVQWVGMSLVLLGVLAVQR